MLKKIVVGLYQANCYILGEKNFWHGVIIDPGDEAFKIINVVEDSGLKIKYILITHGHFDHTGAAEEIRNALNVPIAMHPMDRGLVNFEPDILLKNNDIIQVGDLEIKALHVPGHSPGSLCYALDGLVFTGDALFAGSVGRTDFPGGSHSLLISGIRSNLLTLPDQTRIYPGHGPPSTIGTERLRNPFLR